MDTIINSSCCNGENCISKPDFVVNYINTPAGYVPIVKTHLSAFNHIGAIWVRLGFNRMTYRATPGLYAVGVPSHNSPVFVTANYKLTFDVLRSELSGIDAWILVIDTRGINVWCSAGKGSFSAKEIANRIKATHLDKVVSHRALILPQLAAPGVSKHKLHDLSGFKAEYGPVRASDIRVFLESGKKATTDMRCVHFPFVERIKLVPVEFKSAMRHAIPLLSMLSVIYVTIHGYSDLGGLFQFLLPIIGAFIVGTVFIPAMLPYIPFRSFVLKGLLLGFIWAGIVTVTYHGKWIWLIGNMFFLPAIAAFYALTFTGSTTYTSQSGVNKEIRLYARPIGIAAICGLAFIIASMFIG